VVSSLPGLALISHQFQTEKITEVIMMRNLWRIAGLMLLTTFLWTPPAHARTRVFVRIAPPAVVVESPAPIPHPGYVWRPGYHRWSGARYVWVRGAWVRPPYRYRSAEWVPGHWDHERRGYFWVRGHWARG
jgi:hypothetical protein